MNRAAAALVCGVVSLIVRVDCSIEARHRRAFVDGDVIIGVLLPIHYAPTTKTFTTECGKIWENYGIHRIEALFLTIDEINRRTDILPNVTLGVDVRDECWFTPIALEQTIDFIRTNLYYNDRVKHQTANFSTPAMCLADEEEIAEKPVALVIGPGSSTVSLQVQNLLSLFNVPQIGYSATSNELTEYKYYARVVPPDKHQAEAIAMLCASKNWTYVSLVNTKGTYGGSGIQLFKEYADKLNVCTAMEAEMTETADYSEFDATVRKLNSSRARVVVCFCDGNTLQNLLNATVRLNLTNQFLFVGSDGWADRMDVLGEVLNPKSGRRELSDAALGVISVRVHSNSVSYFDDYFLNLHPSTMNRTRNSWFNEFWQNKFGCNLPGESSPPQFDKPCIGNERLRDKDYKQDTKLNFVVSAVYTAAYALHNFYTNVCGEVHQGCVRLVPVDGTRLMQYLVNVTYQVDNETTVMLDANSDPPAWYDIMNYQKIAMGDSVLYEYSVIGEYQSLRDTANRLSLVNVSQIYWPIGGFGENTLVSRCSPECPFGQIRQLNQDSSKRCCWVCVPCSEYAKIVDNYTCVDCPLGQYPDELRTECVTVPVEYIHWSDAGALFATCFGTIGALIALISLVVFAVHHNTSVVKASTRELSYIILLGILLAYCCTFVLIAEPTPVTCTLNRLVPGIAFTMIYASLATKTNRIARILAGTKRIITKRLRFVSATSQLVITSVLIALQCLIEVLILVVKQPEARVVYPTRKQAMLVCTTHDDVDEDLRQVSLILPLAPNIILIVMCTFYAIKTRNLPENFNEAKFIGFTMYTTCIIWLGFVIVYLGSDFKVITMATSVSLSATVALVLLFFPKLYIILWHPERNVRSAFTTTTDVRCHIGTASVSRPGNSTGNNEGRRSSKFEEAAISLYRQKTMLDKWRRGARNFVSINASDSTNGGGAVAEVTKPLVEFDPLQAEKAAQQLAILADTLNSGNQSRSSTPSHQQSLNAQISSNNSSDLGSSLTNGKLRISHGLCLVSRATQTGDDLLLRALEDLRKRRLAELIRDDLCFTDFSGFSTHSSPTKPVNLSALASKFKSRKMERSSTEHEFPAEHDSKARTSLTCIVPEQQETEASVPLRRQASFDPRRKAKHGERKKLVNRREVNLLSPTSPRDSVNQKLSFSRLLMPNKKPKQSPLPQSPLTAAEPTSSPTGVSCSSINLMGSTGQSSVSSSTPLGSALPSSSDTGYPRNVTVRSSSSTQATENQATVVAANRARPVASHSNARLNGTQIIEEIEESDEDSKLLPSSKTNRQSVASGSSSLKEIDMLRRQGFESPRLHAPIFSLEDAVSSPEGEALLNGDRNEPRNQSENTSASLNYSYVLLPSNSGTNQSLENMSVLGLKLLDKEEERFENLKLYLKSRGLNIDLEEIQTSDV